MTAKLEKGKMYIESWREGTLSIFMAPRDEEHDVDAFCFAYDMGTRHKHEDFAGVAITGAGLPGPDELLEIVSFKTRKVKEIK